ncbi:MAG: SPO1 DNA polymerase [Betaproteobacteria bacterium RBG_16_56_24]|nr:MAG: SPO1 DNA polymerase [Betaproteobacteria bacterium RBG_16_56_24]
MTFKQDCRRCTRLADFLDQVRVKHPEYHALPVSSFGAAGSRFLIVGLAPGMHGANRTGRPFSGDFAGNLLYGSLHKYGFASSADPLNGEGDANPVLKLQNCRITNAVRCLPPQNKPEPSEIRTCNGFVADELAGLPKGGAILALGTIAHQAVLMALQLRKSEFSFGHGARHALPGGLTLFDSYHCSRYNTQTKRLTTAMFEAVIGDISAYLAGARFTTP